MDLLIDDNAIGIVSQDIIIDQVPPKILDNAKECGYTD